MSFNWTVGRVPEEPDTCIIGDVDRSTFFARVVGTPDAPAEPRAKLMAAAPWLLSACQMAYEELTMGGDWKTAKKIIDEAVARTK